MFRSFWVHPRETVVYAVWYVLHASVWAVWWVSNTLSYPPDSSHRFM